MIGLDDIWGDEPEEKDKNMPKKKTRKGSSKPRKVKDTSVGFRMKLGTCMRRGKEGKAEHVPILLAKDPLCWILRIGSNQTYPSSLESVFKTISQQEALQINGDAPVEDLIDAVKKSEERIAEMGRILDKRLREYVLKRAKEG